MSKLFAYLIHFQSESLSSAFELKKKKKVKNSFSAINWTLNSECNTNKERCSLKKSTEKNIMAYISLSLDLNCL